MTLIEHLRELRNRLFWATLGIVAGLIVGFVISHWVFDLLAVPYCNLPSSINAEGQCQFLVLGVTDTLVLRLRIALWVGLIVGGPVWLFQLWAFIAPGLHRHERRWAYVFVAIAAPLFAGGAILAFFVVQHSLAFIMEAGIVGDTTQLEVTAYTGFVTTMILLFGAAFEFPLILLMLNFTGVVSARTLIGWWRFVVFLSFAFAAIATPDPGPFGMILLAACMVLLYLIATGVAAVNDRRRGRGRESYAGLGDDETSPIALDREPVTADRRIDKPSPIRAPEPVAKPLPLRSRYDDMT